MNNNPELILTNSGVLAKLYVFLTSVSVIENEPINHFHPDNEPINGFVFHIKINYTTDM